MYLTKDKNIINNLKKNKISTITKKKVYVIHILSTLNNTLLTLTDSKGNAIMWSSSGNVGFSNTRKSSSYAAQLAGENLGKKCIQKKINFIDIKMRGLGHGKKTSIDGLKISGLIINKIADLTSIPFNGCRPAKKRRV
jgi:small subunit ribosomal protein S11